MTSRLLLPFWFVPMIALAQPADAPPPPFNAGVTFDLGQDRRQDFVYAVTIRGEGANATGGTPRLLISTEDNMEEFAPVSLGGDYVNSQGMMWRATAWVSAMCACQAAGKILTDKHFVVRVGGLIDGPSAGMLMAATMLAQITETPINPDKAKFATMTGAINADGTVGPVGGIPVKLDGASKLKDASGAQIIKRFGYPAGSRYSEDPRTGKKVDLQDPKVNQGVEVVEVRDIYDAFYLLTGREIERPRPVNPQVMSLSPELAADVRKLTTSLRQSATATLSALGTKLDEDILKNVAAANRYAQDSVHADDQSRISEAMYRALVAHALAGADRFLVELRNAQNSGSTVASLKLLKSKMEEVKVVMEALAKTVEASLGRETVGGRTDALNTYLQFWECTAYWQTANKRFNTIAKLADALVSLPGDAKTEQADLLKSINSLAVSTGSMLALMQSRMEVTRALSSLVQREVGKKVSPDSGDLLRLSKAYSFSAVANLELLNALLFESEATKQGKSLESVLRMFELKDDNYALLRTTADASMYGGATQTGDEKGNYGRALSQLGSSLYALVGVTDMIQKNTAFDGRYNAETGKVDLTNTAAISGALALANNRILEEVSEVVKVLGFVPDSIKLNFDLAQSLQVSASDPDRLTALRAYRRCYFLCSFARLLSGL